MEAVKIIFAGCGQIGMAAHLPVLSSLHKEGLISVVGVCDTDLAKAKLASEKFDIPQYGSDWRSLTEVTKANAISVCLPPGPNAVVSAQALEFGLHVICEKPPGRNVIQSDHMASVASARPELVNLIAFNRRFAPLYVKAMKDSLRLGPPHLFYGRFTRPSLGSDPSNTVMDWITSDGSHALDLAVATIGFPHSVSVSRKSVGGGPDNVWTIQLQAEYGSAILLFDFCAGRRVERFEWTGPGYDVLLELPEQGEWAQQGESVKKWMATDLTQSSNFFVNYGFLDEYRAFFNAITGKGQRPQLDFIYGASFMRLVETILKCPSGEIREIPKSTREIIQYRSEAEKVKQPFSTCIDRPVIQILQVPSAQGKYYSTENLFQLSEACDLRLRTENYKPQPGISEANVIITGWDSSPLSPEDITKAERLQLVIVVGASVKGVHPELLLERQVLLCNTADAIAESVAEHCLLLALAGLRRLPEVDRLMHSGEWPPFETGGSLRWSDLKGQVVGVIGWGNIARHFTKLLQPFECKLLVCSEHVSQRELMRFNANRASLGEALGASKIISLHKGLTNLNKGLLGAHELAMIRPGSVLINTARAALIDETALIEKLRKEDILVALDVFHREPLPKKHPFRQFRNVILSPHNASSTPECYQRVGRQALKIALDWISGAPISSIDVSQLENMT